MTYLRLLGALLYRAINSDLCYLKALGKHYYSGVLIKPFLNTWKFYFTLRILVTNDDKVEHRHFRTYWGQFQNKEPARFLTVIILIIIIVFLIFIDKIIIIFLNVVDFSIPTSYLLTTVFQLTVLLKKNCNAVKAKILTISQVSLKLNKKS